METQTKFTVQMVGLDFANPSNDLTTTITVHFDDGEVEDSVSYTANELENSELFAKLFYCDGWLHPSNGGEIRPTYDIEVAIQAWDGCDELVDMFQEYYDALYAPNYNPFK